MLAPIRPRPIIPSCILSTPKLRIVRGKLTRKSGNRLLHGLGKRFEAGLQIFAKMHGERAAAAFGKDVEIAASLRGLYGAERVFLVGHGQIRGVIARDLQKDAAVRAAFVGLAGRMQESRAEAEASGEFLSITNGVTEFLKNFFVFGINGDVPENGEVIASAGAREMLFQYVDES